MKLRSGVKHLGDIQRDEAINRSLRLIENNGVGNEELDLPVEALNDTALLLTILEKEGMAGRRSPESVAHAIQSIFRRVSSVVQTQCPERVISAFQYRYSRYLGPYAQYMNEFTDLHTDPGDTVLCCFGTDVARTQVFKGSLELALPPELVGLPILRARESNYATLMKAINTSVSAAFASGQGEMVELGEGSVDLLDVESVHARSRLLKRGHRHLSFVFFKE